MPARTDRSDLTSPPVPAGARPVWPVTLALVVVGLLLLAWDAWVALVNTAPFFGDTPSRDHYVESGVTLVSAVVPVALLCALGLLLGSRFGLLVLAAPGVLVAAMGLDLLGRPGDPGDPGATRAVRWSDLLADLNRLNALAALAAVATLGLVVSRRRRQTGIRTNP